MKIAIISDVHDNIPNLQKFLDWSAKEGVTKIICCGDLSNIDTMTYLSDKFSGEIFLVRGNVDNYDDVSASQFSNIRYFNRIGHFNIGNFRVGLCHEPFLINKVLEEECQIVFYGHTHKPWIEDREEVKLVNPGALSGLYYDIATFSIWEPETGTIILKNIEEI
jgi:putative phosphoesterase